MRTFPNAFHQNPFCAAHVYFSTAAQCSPINRHDIHLRIPCQSSTIRVNRCRASSIGGAAVYHCRRQRGVGGLRQRINWTWKEIHFLCAPSECPSLRYTGTRYSPLSQAAENPKRGTQRRLSSVLWIENTTQGASAATLMHCTTSHQARGTISFSALSHAAAAASIVNGVVVGKLLSAPQFIRFSVAIASSLRVVGRLLIAGQFRFGNLRIPRD